MTRDDWERRIYAEAVVEAAKRRWGIERGVRMVALDLLDQMILAGARYAARRCAAARVLGAEPTEQDADEVTLYPGPEDVLAEADAVITERATAEAWRGVPGTGADFMVAWWGALGFAVTRDEAVDVLALWRRRGRRRTRTTTRRPEKWTFLAGLLSRSGDSVKPASLKTDYLSEWPAAAKKATRKRGRPKPNG